jgi:tetratricopeptide (TPR) repeat protein
MGPRSSIRLLSLFAVCFAFKGQATTIPEIVAKAKPAVVQVIAFDANWSPIRTGTGFFVSADGDLLTNFHVIRGAVHISARTNTGAIFVFEKLIAGSADSDVAVLKFHANDVDYIKIGNSTNAVEGETVLVIGNPEGFQGTVSNGIISAFRENRSIIQITAPISPGSSGSPVLDETGQVIGMATLVSKEGQNLNFAISAEVIEAVIRSGVVQAVSTPSPTADQKVAFAYYSKALSESQNKDFEGAIKDLTEAIRLKPDWAEAYINRGLAFYGLKQLENAIADYSQAIRLKPNDSAGYFNRARAHDSLAVKLIFDSNASPEDPHKEFSKAIADYTEAIRLKPDTAELFFYRAQDYSQFQQFENAIADCTEAIRLKPEFADAYFWRGVSYKDLGKYTEAIPDLTKSIQLKPDHSAAYYHRGEAYRQLKQYLQSLADFTESIRLDPKAFTYSDRGETYSAMRSYKDAIKDYTEAIRLLPDYANFYTSRGKAYQAIGYEKRANTDLKKADQLRKAAQKGK